MTLSIRYEVAYDCTQDLFPYYQQLIRTYHQLTVLQDTTLQQIQLSPEKWGIAFQRWKHDKRIIVIINLDREVVVCTLNLKDLPRVNAPLKYVLKDILHEESFRMKRKLSATPNPMNGYRVAGYSKKIVFLIWF